MSAYRKLGKKTKLRKALLRTQVTQLIYKGRIITTEARAKEIRRLVEPMIKLAVDEKDNFETVTVKAKVARKDANGKRVKQIIDKDTKEVLSASHRDKDGKLIRKDNGITVTVYDEVDKTVKKEAPSRLHARRQMAKFLYPVVEVPAEAAGKKRGTKEVDLIAKMFDEYGPRYANRNGGYTRIVKVKQRKGDGALMVVLEFV